MVHYTYCAYTMAHSNSLVRNVNLFRTVFQLWCRRVIFVTGQYPLHDFCALACEWFLDQYSHKVCTLHSSCTESGQETMG
jgi:hypothetical protein